MGEEVPCKTFLFFANAFIFTWIWIEGGPALKFRLTRGYYVMYLSIFNKTDTILVVAMRGGVGFGLANK